MTRATRPITLLLVDDHPVVRDGLRGMFAASTDFRVLGEASGGEEAVTLAARLDPDVVLMDLRMAGGSGVAAIREMTNRRLRCRVLVLTTYDTDADVIPAIKAGATGYLLKAALREELFEAVRAAAENRTVFSPSIASRLFAEVRSPAASGPQDRQLSSRERDVLALVAKGTTNREIAKALFISEATVKTHLTHLYAKLGVTDRAAAVAVAYERGILRSQPQRDN
ncbi:response regulator transcription factor [Nocardia sp. CDC159]|uniref:Response regulator transcription factor n=1 Tax=Nocardia pulmonis TaxID=2951408 RepID=A0A9X2J3G7_9NOCA|nr:MULTISPECIES: response regulator transcription factor [Nocardia]MCM6779081.1 response regulator transcription factor [Nocardia pulmonis]MCM6791971.1 response regulator transcription factor [Nocardia sp. CDC159]